MTALPGPRAAAYLLLVGCVGCNLVLGMDAPELLSAVPCDEAHHDCNGDPADGCETDITSDAGHCGQCGHDCLGGECAASTCMPVEIDGRGGEPHDLVVVQDTVFWSNPELGEVVRVGTDGQGSNRSGVVGDGGGGLAVDGDTVYVAGGDRILAIPVQGSSERLVEGRVGARDIAVRGGRLYWTETGVEGQGDGRVVTMELPDGEPSVLIAGLSDPNHIVASDTEVFWTDRAPADSTCVPAVILEHCRTLVRMSNLGGPATVVETVDKVYEDLLIVGDTLFWSREPSFITLLELPDGEVKFLTTSVPRAPRGLAADGTFLFWADRDEPAIGRWPLSREVGRNLATADSRPVRLAVTPEAIYFTEFATKTVRKVANPPSAADRP